MVSKHDTDKLTESVKQLAKHQGAVLVGVAAVERFEPMPPLYDAIRGHHPKDFLPKAKSVISKDIVYLSTEYFADKKPSDLSWPSFPKNSVSITLELRIENTAPACRDVPSACADTCLHVDLSACGHTQAGTHRQAQTGDY